MVRFIFWLPGDVVYSDWSIIFIILILCFFVIDVCHHIKSLQQCCHGNLDVDWWSDLFFGCLVT